ncbi:MAG TPA: DUF2490 domain-containing protein [Cytophagaceae bacterium]|nr:DUF2490 domain-containing protein [Cytophagaceae bacterium]
MAPDVLAQQQYENIDSRIWTKINLEKKITTKFSITYTGGVRMYGRMSYVGMAFSGIGIKYKISKNFRIEFQYRYSRSNHYFSINRHYDGFLPSFKHRFFFDVFYRQKLFKPVVLTIRNGIQDQYTDPFISEVGLIPVYYDRFKVVTHLDLNKRYKPYIASEVYYRFYHSNYGNTFDTFRFYAGVEYEINKKKSIDLFWFYRTRFHVRHTTEIFAVGITYNMDF